jgi:hypothetical protein
MHSGHRFDSYTFFLDTVCTMNPEMNLSIDWRGIFENRWPVNNPIREDCPWIARDGEKARWTIKARQLYAVAEIV